MVRSFSCPKGFIEASRGGGSEGVGVPPTDVHVVVHVYASKNSRFFERKLNKKLNLHFGYILYHISLRLSF